MGEENKTPPWVIVVTSVLSLVGVIATAYFGYLQVKKNTNKSDTPASIDRKDTGRVVSTDAPVPVVEYSLSRFSGAHLRIGNTSSSGIIVVSDLTLQWDFLKCPRHQEPTVGAPLIKYRYTADITQGRGSKLLDNKAFKYGPGDVDDFYVDINYPGRGVYQIWLEFKYVRLGETEPKLYQSPKDSIELCAKMKDQAA